MRPVIDRTGGRRSAVHRETKKEGGKCCCFSWYQITSPFPSLAAQPTPPCFTSNPIQERSSCKARKRERHHRAIKNPRLVGPPYILGGIFISSRETISYTHSVGTRTLTLIHRLDFLSLFELYVHVVVYRWQHSPLGICVCVHSDVLCDFYYYYMCKWWWLGFVCGEFLKKTKPRKQLIIIFWTEFPVVFIFECAALCVKNLSVFISRLRLLIGSRRVPPCCRADRETQPT